MVWRLLAVPAQMNDIWRRPRLAFVVIAWTLGVGSGMGLLWSHASAPGLRARPPSTWPEESGVVRQPGRATLLVFAHPHCPCTRATISELARLMVSIRERVAVHVLFTKPVTARDGWEETDLWNAAVAIPGGSVTRDDGAIEARRFGVATSGQALLYETDGRLRFAGGITSARGHEGDSIGRSAILALLVERAAGGAESPVFGCSLHDPPSRPCGPSDPS